MFLSANLSQIDLLATLKLKSDIYIPHIGKKIFFTLRELIINTANIIKTNNNYIREINVKITLRGY